MTSTCPKSTHPCSAADLCVSRRHMLAVTGAGVAAVLLGDLFGARVLAQDAGRPARFARYPRKLIGTVSALEQDKQVPFLYPGDSELYSGCILIKLGRRAGGGVGPGQDIVAFSAYCAHMGAAMYGAYDPVYKVAGPCPQHLTTYDLTRHGMLVAGHATQSLPQIVLEADGNDLHAVGILGLIYGVHDNLELA